MFRMRVICVCCHVTMVVLVSRCSQVCVCFHKMFETHARNMSHENTHTLTDEAHTPEHKCDFENHEMNCV